MRHKAPGRRSLIDATHGPAAGTAPGKRTRTSRLTPSGRNELPLSIMQVAKANRLNLHYHRQLAYDPAIFNAGHYVDAQDFALAVARYQQQHGLGVDGIAGPRTIAHITGANPAPPAGATPATGADSDTSPAPNQLEPGVLSAADVLEPGVLSAADVLEPGVLSPNDLMEPGVLSAADVLEPGVLGPDDLMEPGVLTSRDQLESGVLGPDDLMEPGAATARSTPGHANRADDPSMMDAPRDAWLLEGRATIDPNRVQRKARDPHEPAADTDTTTIAAAGVAGPAQPLPHLDRIQSAFGHHDLSAVTAHVGGPATAAADALGAEAYATGNHVAFRATPDLHTAAHEAAHVIQQRQGVSLKGGQDQPGDPYERHADAVADAVVSGRSAQALLGAPPAAPAPSAAQAAPVQRKRSATTSTSSTSTSAAAAGQRWTTTSAPQQWPAPQSCPPHLPRGIQIHTLDTAHLQSRLPHLFRRNLGLDLEADALAALTSTETWRRELNESRQVTASQDHYFCAISAECYGLVSNPAAVPTFTTNLQFKVTARNKTTGATLMTTIRLPDRLTFSVPLPNYQPEAAITQDPSRGIPDPDPNTFARDLATNQPPAPQPGVTPSDVAERAPSHTPTTTDQTGIPNIHCVDDAVGLQDCWLTPQERQTTLSLVGTRISIAMKSFAQACHQHKERLVAQLKKEAKSTALLLDILFGFASPALARGIASALDQLPVQATDLPYRVALFARNDDLIKGALSAATKSTKDAIQATFTPGNEIEFLAQLADAADGHGDRIIQDASQLRDDELLAVSAAYSADLCSVGNYSDALAALLDRFAEQVGGIGSPKEASRRHYEESATWIEHGNRRRLAICQYARNAHGERLNRANFKSWADADLATMAIAQSLAAFGFVPSVAADAVSARPYADASDRSADFVAWVLGD